MTQPYNLTQNTNTNNAGSTSSGFGGLAQDLGISSNYQATGPNSAAYGAYANTQQNAQTADQANAAAAQNRGAAYNTDAGAAASNAQIAQNQGQFGNVASTLQGLYSGKTDSQASNQFQSGLDASIAAQQAAANSARGGAVAQASARRGAAEQGAQTNAAATSQAAALAAQNQQAELGLATQNAGASGNLAANQYNIQQNAANTQAQLIEQQNQQNDAYSLGLQNAGNNAASNTLGALNGNTTGTNQTQLINSGVAKDAGAAGGQLFGALTNAAGNVGGLIASDPKLKSDMHHDDSLVEAFLRHVDPKSYSYKEKRDEPTGNPTGGKYLGVSADDVESAPGVGHQLVEEGPRGKQIKALPALSAAMAALGHMHGRLEGLERAMGARKG